MRGSEGIVPRGGDLGALNGKEDEPGNHGSRNHSPGTRRIVKGDMYAGAIRLSAITTYWVRGFRVKKVKRGAREPVS